MSKDKLLKETSELGSGKGTFDNEPDSCYVLPGKKRDLNYDWVKNGEYTQVDFPIADNIKHEDAQIYRKDRTIWNPELHDSPPESQGVEDAKDLRDDELNEIISDFNEIYDELNAQLMETIRFKNNDKKSR